ncbi:MAG: cytochrome c biogenesis protein CcsA [Planctomycetes bacterium]|jgi:ABC-type transport system involved in cytochrome c biogenesis permease subunit|nr:cytochrome c biogenesis protein CcsA [Planctomycetota bacterium]MBT4029709.1 cytochrome c biogenesis protein CcsA [Planctomycetota bacterium]MBT4561209.1 cytochrome c biogenesis protein CcsA [Planctomycetota bacterium]MBT5101338.1 cytochrome c biogenesis protein CcsA [Planctomycetota bacterium]MBT5120770.1 cytochrome c biogenesis protein CcsA [Planctomycetota bacterium]
MEFFSYRNFLYLTQDIALGAAVLALLTALYWFIRGRSGGGNQVASGFAHLPIVLTSLAAVANLLASVARYIEVQHWPAQTMYEVLPMGTLSGFISTLLLYFVLGLHRKRGVSRGFGDLFVAIVMVGSWFTLAHVLELDPTGKALPPALQSYWFSTHITAYMFGYFTLFIAAIAAWLHFCFKFWRGILDSEYQVARSFLWSIAIFTLLTIPFGRMAIMMGVGTLTLTGFISFLSMRLRSGMAWFDVWDEGSDRFTWLVFIIGFPFLTAGLIQGGLWAQEAWALYWGWDSKEVSALISWLFYTVYLHLRFVAGWKGEKGMAILLLGALSVHITFQLFGMLPDSQRSLHRYTDMSSVPSESMLED